MRWLRFVAALVLIAFGVFASGLAVDALLDGRYLMGAAILGGLGLVAAVTYNAWHLRPLRRLRRKLSAALEELGYAESPGPRAELERELDGALVHVDRLWAVARAWTRRAPGARVAWGQYEGFEGGAPRLGVFASASFERPFPGEARLVAHDRSFFSRAFDDCYTIVDDTEGRSWLEDLPQGVRSAFVVMRGYDFRFRGRLLVADYDCGFRQEGTGLEGEESDVARFERLVAALASYVDEASAPA